MTDDNLNNPTPSQRISKQIEDHPDWRGKMLAQLRELIHEAYPDMVEEWKWETAVWAYRGNVIGGGIFKDHVKLNFFKGASLEDPEGLFNAGLDAKKTRAIDFHEGDEINAAALKQLVQAAAALNKPGGKSSK
jgi:hypothetical protein